MKKTLAWVFIVYVASIVLACGILKASEPERLTWNQTLGLISGVERNPDRQAMLLALAISESSLSIRIANGECKPWECDGGRAWGLWQVHKNKYNENVWGSKDLPTQALWAARTLRSQWSRCADYPGVEPMIGRLRAYRGRGCNIPLKGEEKRLALFQKIRAQM